MFELPLSISKFGLVDQLLDDVGVVLHHALVHGRVAPEGRHVEVRPANVFFCFYL